MATLVVTSTLISLMPTGYSPDGRRAKCDLEAASWSEMVQEMRSRFPQLASRVLTDGGDIAPAFVLVVNDEVVRHPESSLQLSARDELCLLASIAGG